MLQLVQRTMIAGVVVLTGSHFAAAAADELKEPKATMAAYLKAFADADTKAMGKFYMPDVIVVRGSTMLMKKYGNLAEGGDIKKHASVKRDRLLKAYETAIAAFGGKEDWKKRGRKLLKQDRKFVAVNDDTVKTFQKIRLVVQPGDVWVTVIPKGDSLTFLLRKNSKGKWRIFAEHWD